MGEVNGRWRYDTAPVTPGRVCKHADSPAHRARPAPHPGPRCATCHASTVAARRVKASRSAVTRTHGITPEQFDLISAAQQGRCALCRVATGARKRLSVDHDHSCGQGHPPKVGCPQCVRGLLCGPCNRIIGHFRDDPEAFDRAAAYLRHPPASSVLRPGTV